jgi:cytochrome d ubiquinol oxidase subunit II
VLPSSTNPAFSLTTANASSTPYTLTIMSWVALAFTPIVLAYQAWTFWVFRRRVSPSDIPAPTGLPVGNGTPPAADRAADTGAHAR